MNIQNENIKHFCACDKSAYVRFCDITIGTTSVIGHIFRYNSGILLSIKIRNGQRVARIMANISVYFLETV